MGLRFSTRKHRTLYWITDINVADSATYCLVKHKNSKIKVKGTMSKPHHADYSLISESIYEHIGDDFKIYDIIQKFKNQTIKDKKEQTIFEGKLPFTIYTYTGLMKELKDFKYFDNVGTMKPRQIIH